MHTSVLKEGKERERADVLFSIAQSSGRGGEV